MQSVLEVTEEPKGPPEATLKRRAQSYSDFHDAVKAVLGKPALPKGPDRIKCEDYLESKDETIRNDLDFAKWYHELEHELLEASYSDYT